MDMQEWGTTIQSFLGISCDIRCFYFSYLAMVDSNQCGGQYSIFAQNDIAIQFCHIILPYIGNILGILPTFVWGLASNLYGVLWKTPRNISTIYVHHTGWHSGHRDWGPRVMASILERYCKLIPNNRYRVSILPAQHRNLRWSVHLRSYSHRRTLMHASL